MVRPFIGFRYIIANKFLYYFAAILFVFGLASYLAPKVFSGGEGFGLDFRVIWLAGSIWADGQNPYGPVFAARYVQEFGAALPVSWLYPPYWYPLAVSFGLLPFTISNVIWNLVNCVLIVVATHLIARAVADVTNRTYTNIFL